MKNVSANLKIMFFELFFFATGFLLWLNLLEDDCCDYVVVKPCKVCQLEGCGKYHQCKTSTCKGEVKKCPDSHVYELQDLSKDPEDNL